MTPRSPLPQRPRPSRLGAGQYASQQSCAPDTRTRVHARVAVYNNKEVHGAPTLDPLSSLLHVSVPRKGLQLILRWEFYSSIAAMCGAQRLRHPAPYVLSPSSQG